MPKADLTSTNPAPPPPRRTQALTAELRDALSRRILAVEDACAHLATADIELTTSHTGHEDYAALATLSTKLATLMMQLARLGRSVDEAAAHVTLSP